MTVKKIARILDAHSVPYFIANGRIIADTMCAGLPLWEETADLTDYTLRELKEWLGY